MKNTFILALGLISATASSQVIIGTGKTAPSSTSVLLEFGTEPKGIIVPYVETLPAVQGGTIVFDTNDQVMKYSNNAGWQPLSPSGSLNNTTTDATSILTAQNSANVTTESAASKAIIGAESSTATGVLVLESSTKAMVLPTVSDYTLVKNPSPGMMVYINKTGAKRLAVFNGSTWSFWKP